jgi:hypothetical protein
MRVGGRLALALAVVGALGIAAWGSGLNRYVRGLLGVPQSTSETPSYRWFYRFVVELTQVGQPITIDVVIACASQERQILGEGRSVRAVWAPYIYGVRVSGGHGVLVQSPNVCERDVTKNPVSADFLPLVLWAPDAGNLEFLVAYLHERAYEQSFSKLGFLRASIVPATEADYRAWLGSKAKENIVPLGDSAADHVGGASFFRGGGFFPKADPRNYPLVRMDCHSYLRLPLPEILRARLRELWPSGRPRYWLLDDPVARALIGENLAAIREHVRAEGLSDTTDLVDDAALSSGVGIKRASGIGHVAPPGRGAPGEMSRIPYRVASGYPWAQKELVGRRTIDVHADTRGGADQGFAYCFRDLIQHYLRDPKTGEFAARAQRFFIDDELIGTTPDLRVPAPSPAIAERDEYVWRYTRFPLTHELGRMR